MFTSAWESSMEVESDVTHIDISDMETDLGLSGLSVHDMFHTCVVLDCF